MVTLQEWLEQKYPNKNEVKTIVIQKAFEKTTGENSLIVDDYPNLLELGIICPKSKEFSLIVNNCPKLTKIVSWNGLANFDLNNCPNITQLLLSSNKLTGIDFLTKLSHPEKLEILTLSSNFIQPNTLDFLKPFVNLKTVRLGIDKDDYEGEGKTNLFYGSLEPCKNLTKLKELCIAGTDIDSGLEYLPDSLVQRNKILVTSKRNTNENNAPDCQPIRPNAKVKAIQDQLRPFNYDISAWRLANVNLVNSAERIKQLEDKISETQEQLNHTRQNESDKTKKIERLESKLKILEETKKSLEQEHKSQLTELATILFPPSNDGNDIANISFSDLKNQAENIKKENKELEQTVSNLNSEKELLENNLQAQIRQNQSLTDELTTANNIIAELNQQLIQLNLDQDNLITKAKSLTENLADVSSELLGIKRKELTQLLNQIKGNLDENLHDYLEILLDSPAKSSISDKAKRNLTNKVDGNELQKLVLLQYQVNHLEERINQVSEYSAWVEVTPPSYN